MRQRAEEMKKLSQIARLREKSAQTKLSKIALEESRLRSLIAELDRTTQQAKHDMSQDLITRQLGLDISWQQWVARQRRDLNMRLARSLAEKEPALHSLQSAFGRKQAVEALVQKQSDKIARKTADEADRQSSGY